jgi:hypothetical protein
MNYRNIKISKCIITFLCICVISSCWTSCFAGNLSLRLVAASGTNANRVDDAKPLDSDNKGTAKWYTVSSKISAKVSTFESIATRKNEGKLEVLLYCTDKDITSKDILNVQHIMDRNNKPVLSLALKEDAKKRLSDLTSQNIGKFLAEVVNDEIVCIIKIAAPLWNGFVLYNVTWDELNRVQASQNLSVPYLKDNQSAIHLTIWHLFAFLVFIIALVLSVIPAKKMPRKKTPRVWIGVFAAISGVVGGYELGVSRSTGVVEVSKGLKAFLIEYHISLLYLFLGAIAGVVVGILCSYPAWFLFRRIIFNASRLLRKFFSKKTETDAEKPNDSDTMGG